MCVCECECVCMLSHSLCLAFVTPWTVTRQSMEFLRPEHWNGLPFPTPGNHFSQYIILICLISSHDNIMCDFSHPLISLPVKKCDTGNWGSLREAHHRETRPSVPYRLRTRLPRWSGRCCRWAGRWRWGWAPRGWRRAGRWWSRAGCSASPFPKQWFGTWRRGPGNQRFHRFALCVVVVYH